MGQMRVRRLFVETGGVGLGAAEDTFLLREGQFLPRLKVVDPALGVDKTAAGSRLSIGNNSDLAVPFDLRVACAVDEASHVKGGAVDERHGLSGDFHMPLQRLASIPLGLPDLVL